MSQNQRNQFVFIPGQRSDDDEISAKPLLVAGAKHVPENQINQFIPDGAEQEPEPEQPLTPKEQLVLREEIIREYDALRSQYIHEGEKARYDAKQWAQRLIETTENDIRKLYQKNVEECAQAKTKADEQGYKEGYERGFSEGSQNGHDKGYSEGLGECTDTLKELTAALQTFDKEHERYFKEYEKNLFDVIFTIANKITVDSLKQKDKAVITKMLNEAAKGFRHSEYVKVTLSKLDTEQYAQTGLDILKEAFRDTQHIEFEIVKDAPQGTLILDNGSEITDAGVATQLMMIEKLGKGKFRDKTEETE